MINKLHKVLTTPINLKRKDHTINDEALFSESQLISQFPGVLCVKDSHGRWLQASDELLTRVEIEPTSFLGKTDNELMEYPNSNQKLLSLNHQIELKAWETDSQVKESILLKYESGDIIEVELTAIPITKTINSQSRLIVCGKFSNQSNKILDKLYLLDSMFNFSHLSFIILDKDLNIININKAFKTLTDLSFDDVYGKNLSHINIGKNHELSTQILKSFHDEDFDLWEGEIICPNEAKGAILAKLEITRIINEDNITSHYFATLIDITFQKKNEKRIRQIAHYDGLTGLSNRVLFMERLNQSLSECKRHNKSLILFFIDLDKFKEVNDSYGHDIGDKVLKESANRFLSITRKEDIVSRFSGDEFAILFICEKPIGQILFEASIISNKIIKQMSNPFFISNKEIFIGSSIGISIFPDHGDSVENLLKKADIAMYEAKNRGRNNFQFYRDEFSIATNNRLEIEKKLRQAIINEEFKLFYQPQFLLKDNKIWGAEVLIRWFELKQDFKKLVSPEIFIPIAEDSGLIVEIGQWILEKACTQLKLWMDSGLPIKQISVNVSARQFMDSGFVNSVSNAIKKSGIQAQDLELEITESMLVGDIKRIELQLTRLKSMGVKIALDDFGTGYSSLSYLKNFPIDVLKIDQSFIKEMTADSKDAKITCAIIEMGHSLDQKIIAEGVENEEQLLFLTQRGCDIVQGYYYSMPLPVNKMTEFLKLPR
ncbi:MAG: EAL domain-containing protein [Gammaproteobacteria bacterium]|nr:EAL domain-containing protein [Gammaproteobacteria bacterium]